MTKAMTAAERRRRKKASNPAVERLKALSGVDVAASAQSRHTARSEPVADVIGPALARVCAICGLPDTAENRKRVRNMRHGTTLWGKLRMLDRLDEDQFAAIAEADMLDQAYRRQVLGAPIAGPGDAGGIEIDQDRIRALTDAWMGLQGALGCLSPGQRAILLWVREAGPDERPDALDDVDGYRLRLACNALARHFGLRA